ncbi:uncharacterized protein LOC126315367 [Schistocerca gregaria]|uniref:uncharacterized protein LOC126315367 n=1 Tax=Schistocerca gregaria TaxID=7010 RepID=UPI00211EE75F|nr:uncharacterized protein LOC126315367 [Schistocerca gregaria]
MRAACSLENMKCKADMDYDVFKIKYNFDSDNSVVLRDAQKEQLRTCVCKKHVDLGQNTKKIMNKLALDCQDTKKWGFIAPRLETSYLLDRSFDCSCGLSISVTKIKSCISINVLLFESIFMFHAAMCWMFLRKSDMLEYDQLIQDTEWKDFVKERAEDLYLLVILGPAPNLDVDRESLNIPFLKTSEYSRFSPLTQPGSIVRTTYSKKGYIFEGMSEVTADKHSFNNESYLDYMNKTYMIKVEDQLGRMASVREFTLNHKKLCLFEEEGISVRNKTLLSPEFMIVYPLDLDFLFRGSTLIPIFEQYKRLVYVFHFIRLEIGVQISVDLANEALTDVSLSEKSNYKHLSSLGDSVLNYITTLSLFGVCSSVGEIDHRCVSLVKNQFLAGIFEDMKLDVAVDFQHRGKKLPNYSQLSMHEKAGLIEALLCASFISGGIEKARELLSKISPKHKQLFNAAVTNEMACTFSTEHLTDSLKLCTNRQDFRLHKNSRMRILRSYLRIIYAKSKAANRKLALLGDSCLDLLVMWCIFKNCPFVKPSQASAICSKLVSNSHFTKLVTEYGLVDELSNISSPTQPEAIKNLSNRYFGTLFESIVGAIFLDLDNSTTLFIQLFEPLFEQDVISLSACS